jgi:hypothetical protein
LAQWAVSPMTKLELLKAKCARLMRLYERAMAVVGRLDG